MRIMNICIVSLILIKFYVMLITILILLIMIEDVLCYLCELYFEAEKLVIWIVWILVFLGSELMIEETVTRCVS
jgi:hypothetical protein